ncbi:MAG: ATP-binding protein [Gemmatimonadetes bacterium]|nr:ATP-binding protein [Gemmatimonadota bacterium]MYD12948.1 ATP-binding protein [Gemmatimonadota bacterium]MYE71501.1 ATP-binding protein [Gemmatimonadota bacterium]MYJ70111.1 ATP-binding protein [Gemmatimonadota bacterium]
MIKRNLILPRSGRETFFLWGPRQTGKTTLLREHYPGGHWIDLLKSDDFRRYATRPELLRLELEMGSDSTRQTVIDEVQKVPALLNEVHWLMENRGLHFALCGSSARRVRRGAANLLGGRAVRYELRGVAAGELGDRFDLDRLLNHGYLPRIHESARPRRLLDSYIADYLKEEIAAEGLVRSLPAFAGFLDAAALSDTEPVNFSNIARECGVSSQAVRNYFGILEDTLLGRWLPAWRKRRKRRLSGAAKFYFSDVGVVNRLARRGTVERGSELYGKAFENWVHHELAAFVAYTEFDGDLTHWRLPSGVEVDFVLGDMTLAVEAKATAVIGRHHLKGLRSLATEHAVLRRVIVCLETKARRTEDGIEVLPAASFVRKLWRGELTGGA